MNTEKWGNPAWTFLHTITFNYSEAPTEENKLHMIELFSNLQHTLPCRYCRDSYRVFFRYINIRPFLDGRMGLTYWLYVIHNLVNLKLDKETVRFDKVVKRYEASRAGKDKACECAEAEEKLHLGFAQEAEARYAPIANRMIKAMMESGESPIPKQSWNR
jgi:hypothetical protein